MDTDVFPISVIYFYRIVQIVSYISILVNKLNMHPLGKDVLFLIDIISWRTIYNFSNDLSFHFYNL